jgi:hypothetical protein
MTLRAEIIIYTIAMAIALVFVNISLKEGKESKSRDNVNSSHIESQTDTLNIK